MMRLHWCAAYAASTVLFGCNSGTEEPNGAGPQVQECPDALSDCSGTCIDLLTDPNHCGECGRVCAAEQTCQSGTCLGEDGIGGSVETGTGGTGGGTGGGDTGGTNSGGTGGSGTGGLASGGTGGADAGTGGSVVASCAADASIELATSVPEQFRQSPANAGTLEKVSHPVHYYTSETSGGPGDLPRQDQAITKEFNIYLPYDYSEDVTYPLVVVLHGITDNEDTWVGSRSEPRPKAMLDALIDAGEIQPLVAVFPNACASSNFANCGFGDQAGYYYFDNELMNDLLPFLESNYSVTTSRDCRGLAGFSMGGMQTINLGMCRNLEHFASFAPFAAAPTSYPASQVAECLTTQNQQGSYPISFFYNAHGDSDDTAGASHQAAINGLVESSEYLSSENFAYHTVPGGHDYPQAMIGLYNFLRIAFSN